MDPDREPAVKVLVPCNKNLFIIYLTYHMHPVLSDMNSDENVAVSLVAQRACS